MRGSKKATSFNSVQLALNAGTSDPGKPAANVGDGLAVGLPAVAWKGKLVGG